MNRSKTSRRSRRGHSPVIVRGVASAGLWAAAALSALMGSQAFAQQPPPSPTAGGPPAGKAPAVTPAGSGTTLSSDPKLLAPLPPPSAEVLKRNPPSPDPRNLEGVWVAEPQPFPTMSGMPNLPYTDSAKQRWERNMQRQRDADAQGKVLLTESGRCRPMSSIGIGSELFPAEVVQTADKIIILIEEGRGRWVIHLNGKHPQNVKPSHFGHSVGHWEGDTLVVDTVGLHANESLFGALMRSDKARVVSRLRKLDGGSKLELISTTHDPQTYTRPVEGARLISNWHPEVAFLEFQCEENMEGAREGMVE